MVGVIVGPLIVLIWVIMSAGLFGQTLAQEIPITQWAGASTASTIVPPPYNPGPTACTLGPYSFPVVGAQNPFCRVSSALGPIRYAALDFAAYGLTCMTVALLQPGKVDATRPLALQFAYTRIGGGIGDFTGQACIGECAQLRAHVAALRDFDTIVTPAYGSTYTVYLPNGGPQSQGRKMTAVASIRFTAAPLEPLMVEICRKPDEAGDTSTGSLRLVNPLIAIWPVQP